MDLERQQPRGGLSIAHLSRSTGVARGYGADYNTDWERMWLVYPQSHSGHRHSFPLSSHVCPDEGSCVDVHPPANATAPPAGLVPGLQRCPSLSFARCLC